MDALVEESWRDARRSRMLGAAARIFARSSFEQASMDEIAHEAGVGKPTLYRYFPSKDALFAAVFEQALDALEVKLDVVLEQGGRADSMLGALVAEIIPTFREHLVSLRFLGGIAAAVDQSRRRVFRERRIRIGSYLAAALDHGMRRGEIRTVDSAKVAQLVIGMVWSATATLPASDEEIGRDIVDIILHGLDQRGSRAATEPTLHSGRERVAVDAARGASD